MPRNPSSPTIALAPDAGTAGLPRAQASIYTVLFAALIVLRVFGDFTLAFDADEPQHFHVAWAWTQGMVPYRDVFDNHSPLFTLLMAPIVRLIGESPSALIDMRLVMLPIATLAFWLVYRLSRKLFDHDTAMWAVLLSGLAPCVTRVFEYRPLALWLVVWLSLVLVLIGGRFSPKRAFCAGLLGGLLVGISLKSALLLLSLAVAGALLLAFDEHARQAAKRAAWGRSIVAFLAGLLVVPSAIAIVFIRMGVWNDLVYCTVTYNVLPDVGDWRWPLVFLISPVGLASTCWLVRTLKKRHFVTIEDTRVAFLVLLTGTFLSLVSAWPLITGQTLVPGIVLLVVVVVGLAIVRERVHDHGSRERGLPRWSAAFATVLLAFALNLIIDPPSVGAVEQQEALVQEVLTLTKPGEYVLDAKGEALFRPRCCYPIMESLTRERYSRGLLEDDIADACTAAQTRLVSNHYRNLPPAATTFVTHNYLRAGAAYVAGQVLGERKGSEAQDFKFNLAIRAPYTVVSEYGSVTTQLDGHPWIASRMLEPGQHTLNVRGEGHGKIAVVWTRAIEHGYLPSWSNAG